MTVSWDLEDARDLLSDPEPQLGRVLESLESAVSMVDSHDSGGFPLAGDMESLDGAGMVQFRRCNSEFVEVRIDERLWWFNPEEDPLGTVRLRLTRGDLEKMLDSLDRTQ